MPVREMPVRGMPVCDMPVCDMAVRAGGPVRGMPIRPVPIHSIHPRHFLGLQAPGAPALQLPNGRRRLAAGSESGREAGGGAAVEDAAIEAVAEVDDEVGVTHGCVWLFVWVCWGDCFCCLYGGEG